MQQLYLCILNGNALTIQEFEDKITLLNYMTINLVIFTSMSSLKKTIQSKNDWEYR